MPRYMKVTTALKMKPCTCPDEGRACERCLALREAIRKMYVKDEPLEAKEAA